MLEGIVSMDVHMVCMVPAAMRYVNVSTVHAVIEWMDPVHVGLDIRDLCKLLLSYVFQSSRFKHLELRLYEQL